MKIKSSHARKENQLTLNVIIKDRLKVPVMETHSVRVAAVYCLPYMVAQSPLTLFRQNCDKRLWVSCLSICPHATTWIPIDVFSLQLMFEYFSKICPENSSSIEPNMNNEYFI